jgi:hypothetical protein
MTTLSEAPPEENLEFERDLPPGPLGANVYALGSNMLLEGRVLVRCLLTGGGGADGGGGGGAPREDTGSVCAV